MTRAMMNYDGPFSPGFLFYFPSQAEGVRMVRGREKIEAKKSLLDRSEADNKKNKDCAIANLMECRMTVWVVWLCDCF